MKSKLVGKATEANAVTVSKDIFYRLKAAAMASRLVTLLEEKV